MISFGAILGGISIILGNLFVLRGDVYNSIKMFLLADIGWVMLAFSTGDWIGFSIVMGGVVISIFVFMKMHLGIFHKSISKER